MGVRSTSRHTKLLLIWGAVCVFVVLVTNLVGLVASVVFFFCFAI